MSRGFVKANTGWLAAEVFTGDDGFFEGVEWLDVVAWVVEYGDEFSESRGCGAATPVVAEPLARISGLRTPDGKFMIPCGSYYLTESEFLQRVREIFNTEETARRKG